MVATAKKQTKVIDAVHRGDTPPAPSGRPVIVTNRPFMTVDPMLAPDDIASGDEKPSGEPAPKPSDKNSGVPKLSREAKNIIPVQDTPNDSVPQEASDAPMTKHAEPEKKDEPVSLAPLPVPETKTSRREGIQITPPKHDGEPTDRSEEINQTEVELVEDGVEEQKVDSPEEDPKAAKDIEIERHIAAGTYFVPIGQVKRRRRKTLLLFLLIVVFAAIVLDALLDMGILNIDPIPHTSFFS